MKLQSARIIGAHPALARVVSKRLAPDNIRYFLGRDTKTLCQNLDTSHSGERDSTHVPRFWLPPMGLVRWLAESGFQRLHFLSGR